MRRALLTLALLLATLSSAGCAETVRCPAGQVFDREGSCVPIADAGPARPDAGADASSSGG